PFVAVKLSKWRVQFKGTSEGDRGGMVGSWQRHAGCGHKVIDSRSVERFVYESMEMDYLVCQGQGGLCCAEYLKWKFRC
ncbi:hypothetical protein U1Q18_051260, partial [Sarracenia purpurea var. burkii]